MARCSRCDKTTYLCRGDQVFHYKSELPATLRPFVDYVFSSGGIAGDDFKSFNTKFKNHLNKILPEGFSVTVWNKMHYECSCIIQTPSGRYIYVSIPDVRYNPNEWFTNILYRTVSDGHGSRSGQNRFTDLFNLVKDIQKLEAREIERALAAGIATH